MLSYAGAGTWEPYWSAGHDEDGPTRNAHQGSGVVRAGADDPVPHASRGDDRSVPGNAASGSAQEQPGLLAQAEVDGPHVN